MKVTVCIVSVSFIAVIVTFNEWLLVSIVHTCTVMGYP